MQRNDKLTTFAAPGERQITQVALVVGVLDDVGHRFINRQLHLPGRPLVQAGLLGSYCNEVADWGERIKICGERNARHTLPVMVGRGGLSPPRSPPGSLERAHRSDDIVVVRKERGEAGEVEDLADAIGKSGDTDIAPLQIGQLPVTGPFSRLDEYT